MHSLTDAVICLQCGMLHRASAWDQNPGAQESCWQIPRPVCSCVSPMCVNPAKPCASEPITGQAPQHIMTAVCLTSGQMHIHLCPRL